MSNRSYNASGEPVFNSPGASEAIRTEFTAVAAGFAEIESEISSVSASLEWVNRSYNSIYSTSSQFVLTGIDATDTMIAGRKLRLTINGDYVYTNVVSSSYTTNTIVNVLDSVVTNLLTLVEYSVSTPETQATIGTLVESASSKSVLAGSDLFPISDSAAGGLLKNTTYTDLKTDLSSTVQTLTNKTISLTNNTFTGTLSEFNTALTDGTFATLTGAESLTNKTVNGLTLAHASSSFSVAGGTSPKTLTVDVNAAISDLAAGTGQDFNVGALTATFVNGLMYTSGNLADDIETIGSAPVTLKINTAMTAISTLIDVPSNISVEMEYPGIFTVNTGKRLRFLGPFKAPLTHCFIAETGSVLFGQGSITEVYPEWWATNTTPGVTDMTTAVQSAINSCPTGATDSYRTKLIISQDMAWTTVTIGEFIEINCQRGCVITALASSALGVVQFGPNVSQEVVINGMVLQGSATSSANGFYAASPTPGGESSGGLWSANFRKCRCLGFLGAGFYFKADDPVAGKDVANQFITLEYCEVKQADNVNARSIYAEGQWGQVRVVGGWYGGISDYGFAGSVGIELVNRLRDGSWIGPNGSDTKYCVSFDTVSIGVLNTGVIGNYISNINFRGCQFENMKGSINIIQGSQVNIDGCGFANGANDGGHGYLVSNANGHTTWHNNVVSGVTDALVIGYCSLDASGTFYSDGPVVETANCTYACGPAAATLATNHYDCVLVTASATEVTTISSKLDHGQLLQLRCLALTGVLDRVTLNNSGNITIPYYLAPTGKLDIHQSESVLIRKNDTGGAWTVVASPGQRFEAGAAPTVGTWRQGDYVKNSYCGGGAPKGWYCTTAGSGAYPATTRANTTAYPLATQARWTTGNTIWVVTVAGTSAGSAPSIVGKVVGDTVVDGGITWQMVALQTAVFTSEGNL